MQCFQDRFPCLCMICLVAVRELSGMMSLPGIWFSMMANRPKQGRGSQNFVLSADDTLILNMKSWMPHHVPSLKPGHQPMPIGKLSRTKQYLHLSNYKQHIDESAVDIQCAETFSFHGLFLLQFFSPPLISKSRTALQDLKQHYKVILERHSWKWPLWITQSSSHSTELNSQPLTPRPEAKTKELSSS